MTGRIDRRGRELQIRANEVREPAPRPASSTDPGVLVVDLPAAACSPGVLEKLETLFEGSPGRRAGARPVPVLRRACSRCRSGRSRSTGRGRCSTSSVTCSGRRRRGSSTSRSEGGRLRRRGYRASMPFSVLPAIDVSDGRLGGLTADGPRADRRVRRRPVRPPPRPSSPPGARWLHVVDMDLAFRGTLANGEVIAALARDPGIARPGERRGADRRAGRAPSERGRRRVSCVASAALADEDAVTEIIERSRPGETVLGIEVADGRDPRSRRRSVDLDLMSTLGWLRTAGRRRFLVTAVARVGDRRGSGHGARAPRRARRACRSLAAGGIRSLADLEAVRDAGADGAVVGRCGARGLVSISPRRSPGRRSEVRGCPARRLPGPMGFLTDLVAELRPTSRRTRSTATPCDAPPPMRRRRATSRWRSATRLEPTASR